MRHLALARFNRYAHNLGDFGGSRRAADRTAVDRRGAFHDRGRQAVTAWVAAAAAVCARQALANQRYALIHLDGEHLGRHAEQDREHDAHDKQDSDRVNNIHGIHFLSSSLLTRSTGRRSP